MAGDERPLSSGQVVQPAKQLDELAHDFQELWATGKRPRIEDFVLRVSPQSQPLVLERLLRIECELQSQSGETLALRDYREQFPQYRDVIDSVLADLSTGNRNSDQTRHSHSYTVAAASSEQANTLPIGEGPSGLTGRLAPDSTLGKTSNHFGDYELLGEIARGGMGVVYRARQRKLNRIVAIKMILAGQFASHDDVLRFYSEAESAARLDHPGIVPIYEVNEIEGRHFFSMGFVDGQSLHERVTAGPLPQREAAQLVRQVAEAVHYAHQQGIVHRDLKPRNILITADGHPKVTDFGLAKSLEGDSGLTVSGQILGTPGYMPPEQATGKLDQIGPRADVYSLGAVLYCLLTGRPPFQSASAVETIKQVLETPPASPRLLNPAIDRDLETICLKCLEKNVSHRYQTAADLAEELTRYLAGEPIQARRIGVVGKSWRWLRRRPLVAAFSASLLLLALVIPSSVMFVMRAQEASANAELRHKIDLGLDEPQVTEAYLAKMESLLAALGIRHPDEAEQDRQRLHAAFGEQIRGEIAGARLDAQSAAGIREALALLEPRDVKLAATLRGKLELRLRDWQTVFQLQPPFDNASELVDPGQVALRDARLLATASADEGRRVLTTVSSEGIVQLEARFDEHWSRSSRLGLSLKAEPMRGYDFFLQADDARTVRDEPVALPETGNAADQKLTFESIRARDGYFTLAIYRNGLLLLREQLHQSELPPGPLVLRATCEQAQLKFVAGTATAVSIRDPFPIPSRRAGVFALHCSSNVGILSVQGRRKPKASAASPLERGDELFETGDFELALGQYRQQATEAGEGDFQRESRYKQGLCLVQLGRLDDAASLLESVMNGDEERWEPIAGCQLWLLRLRQKQQAAADSVFDQLSTRFQFDQVASLIPQELRQEILDSYHSDLDSLGGALRFNPELLTRLRRLTAVDRFLSLDGRGRPLVQIEVARGYHLLGDLPSALQAAEGVAQGTRDMTVMRHYLRLMRLNGDPRAALEELDKYEAAKLPKHEARHAQLILERARILAALERWQDCERVLDIFHQFSRNAETSDPAGFTYFAMMKGMLLERRGALGPAQAVWRQGYNGMRKSLQQSKAFSTETLNAVILGSLCGELTEEEGRQFVTSVVNRGGDNAIIRQAEAIVGTQLTSVALQVMWRSPLGRKYAEDFAFERLTLRDRVKVPAILLTTEYFNQAAFQQEMTEPQSEAVFNHISKLYDLAIYDGKFTIPQVAQIALTWKGTSNFLGWSGVAPSLDSELRSGFAYVFAHRYLKLGNRTQALKFLDTTLKDAPAGSVHARLAAEDKELLSSDRGRLIVTSDLPEQVQLRISQAGQEVALVDVAATQEIAVPVGDLEFSLVSPRSDLRLSRTSVNMTPMGRRRLQLNWLWKPEIKHPPLTGLIPQPSSNAVGARWQLVYHHPAQETRGLAWNATGDQFVTASNDGHVRVYDAATLRVVSLLPGGIWHPRDLLWSPRHDRIVACGWDGWLRCWDAPSGELLFEHHNPHAIESLAENGNGSLLAYGTHATEVAGTVLNSNGVVQSTWQVPRGGAREIALSPDGQWLAICVGEQRVIEVVDLTSGQRQQLAEAGQPYLNVAFSPDNQFLAASEARFGVRLWRTSDWQPAHVLPLTGEWINDLQWTADSQSLLAAANDQHIVEFSLKQPTPGEARRFPAQGISRIALNPSSDQLLAAHNHGRLALISRGDGSVRAWGENQREHSSVAVRPVAGREIAIAGHNQPLKLLTADGKLLAVADPDTPRPHHRLTWSSDGQWLASNLDDGRLALWKPDGTFHAAYELKVPSNAWSLGWTDENQLVVACADFQVRTVQPADGVVVGEWAFDRDSHVVVDHRRGFVATTGSGDAVLIRQANGTKLPALGGEPPLKNVNLLAFAPRGDRFTVRSWGRQLTLWNESGEQVAEFPQTQDQVAAMAWNPAGTRFASCTREGEFQVWTDTGTQITKFRSPGFSRVNDLAWIDDERFVSVGEDTCVRIWNAAARQPETVTLLLHNNQAARFTNSGRLLDTTTSLEEKLLYVVENRNGALDLLRPGEFAVRTGAPAAGATTAEATASLPAKPPSDAPSKDAEQLVVREIAKLKDPEIVESSGLASSARDDALWTHNDDEKSARLYLVDREGKTLARYDLRGEEPTDWEDICAFIRRETRYLLVGDIGDNYTRRKDCRLHLLQEPDLSAPPSEATAIPIEKTIPFVYEDGPRDCEALAVDIERNVALLITKELDDGCRMYEVPLDGPADKPATAKHVRDMKLPLVTAMDISPDGRRMVVLGALHAFEYTRAADEPWAKALDRLPRRYTLPQAKQAEAIAYRRDGKALLLTSEGEHAPLWEITLQD